MPGQKPGIGRFGARNGRRTFAPHEELLCACHGRFERLITQIYFPDEPLNASDRLPNAALPLDFLIAKPV